MTGPTPQPRRRARMSLRLAVAVTALVAVVLVLAGAAVTMALRGFLTDRVDQQLAQLADLAPGLFGWVEADGDEPTVGRPREDALTTPGALAVAVAPDGSVVATARGPGAVPVDPAVLRDAAGGPGEPVDAVVDGQEVRVLTRARSDGLEVVVALPLEPVHLTITRLLLIEAVVGAVALVLVAAGSFLVVTRGLRPLSRIAADARRITTTDLVGPAGGARPTIAVTVGDPHDPAEVADLSAALETMLGHIEAALTARDDAERRLRRFVADASHELRTPLQSIRGYAELTRRGVVDSAAAVTVAGRIEDEAVRMGRLVDDLLLLARLDQGRPLERQPVDLAVLAADAVADARAAAPDRAVALTVATANATVTGDPDRLRQVLANLLTNARVHTPPGTPVRVRVDRSADGVEVAVSDAGPGIPEAARAHVFERFYRTDAGRSRDVGGSGLGLSIVRSVVTAHDGRVCLDSGPTGTTVRVLLPAP